jgi:hypothetical protein
MSVKSSVTVPDGSSTVARGYRLDGAQDRLPGLLGHATLLVEV